MNKKKGIVFGLRVFQDRKTSISKNIKKNLSKMFGKTIILSGDILRKFFDRSGYSKKRGSKFLIRLAKY